MLKEFPSVNTTVFLLTKKASKLGADEFFATIFADLKLRLLCMDISLKDNMLSTFCCH